MGERGSLNWNRIRELFEDVERGKCRRSDAKMADYNVRCYEVRTNSLIRIDIARHPAQKATGG